MNLKGIMLSGGKSHSPKVTYHMISCTQHSPNVDMDDGGDGSGDNDDKDYSDVGMKVM